MLLPTSKYRRQILLASLAALPLSLSACFSGDKKLDFEGSDITGTDIGQDLDMLDTSGQRRTLADYKGQVVLVFFGYTQCPDICPTAMAQAAQAMELLGEASKDVRVLMVSVDPERDTPEILEAYVQVFDPSFIGLTGSPEQLEKTARSFKAFYAKEEGPTPEQYAMNHSSAFFLFDRKGNARAILGLANTPEDMAHDIRLLL